MVEGRPTNGQKELGHMILVKTAKSGSLARLYGPPVRFAADIYG